MVIGVSYRTASVAVRERFWMSESRRHDALAQFSGAEAVEEIVVLATCNRTEFILWTQDASAAAGSVLNFLTREFGLRLCEWQHFYRLLDEAALAHLFRVASSLDSMVVGEPEIVAQVKAAWAQAQQAHTTGRFLDAVFQKALTVSKRVRNETAIGSAAVSVPSAAVELARQIFGSLEERRVLVLGAGKMSELSARYLKKYGAREVRVLNRTLEHAQELASSLGGVAVPFEQLYAQVAQADVVISSTSCPQVVLTRNEVARILDKRDRGPLLLIDIAVPRDIDPAAREVPGVFLYDIDGLDQVVKKNAGQRQAAATEAEQIVTAEARLFRNRLLAERVVPTIVALRGRLDEICRQELEAFRRETGPLPQDQDQALETLTARITQRLAGSLARELKDLPGQVEQDQLTDAVQRLFHLVPPAKAAVGTN
jgi:glutamyl-tRNA reductase